MIRPVIAQTMRGILSHPTSVLITIGTVSASLSILVAALCAAFNLDRLSAQWEKGGDVLVFLKPGLTGVDVQGHVEFLKKWPEIQKLNLHTSQDAQAELEEILGDSILQGLGSEMLPATLEIELPSKISSIERLKFRAKLLELKWIDEVESVTEGRGLLARLYQLRASLKIWVWLIGLWIGISVAFIIDQLVRLNLFHRRQELDVLRAVGATERFIQWPLMLEGALQTGFGALLALGLIWSLLETLIDSDGILMRLFQFQFQFLPYWSSFLFVMGCAAVGWISSWRASRLFLRQIEAHSSF